MYVVLGICGSLRRGSINAALLRAYEELAPGYTLFESARIDDLPLYNEDLRRNSRFPASVQRLREQIRYSDGILIATPEIAQCAPGGLINAIDWVSCSPQHLLRYKPVGLVGASQDCTRTIRAQQQLSNRLRALDALVLERPDVALRFAHEKFDVNGKLVDLHTRMRIERHVDAFTRLMYAVETRPA